MAKHYLKLSAILKKLLFDKDMKPADLARALDIPPPTIHRLVTGKSTRPYVSSLKPIADFFSITPSQLLGEEPLNSDNYQNIFLPANIIKTIPVMANWRINDNFGLKNIQNNSVENITVTGKVSNDAFALIMNDYSMIPLFPKGTILIFDPHIVPKDRSYVLIKLKGSDTLIFRQLLIDADHRYSKPLNPDLNAYKMRLFKKEDTIIATLFESRINHEPNSNNDAIDSMEKST